MVRDLCGRCAILEGMKSINFFFPVLLAAFALTPLSAEEPKLESIFNGKDLSGWDVPKDNIWFTVKDGVLMVKNGPKSRIQIVSRLQSIHSRSSGSMPALLSRERAAEAGSGESQM